MTIINEPVESQNLETKLMSIGNLLVEQANNVTINNQAEYEAAAGVLVEIKARIKQVRDYWSKPKSNAKAAHQEICDREKAMIAPLNKAEIIIKNSMVGYQAAVEKARLEAEENMRKIRMQESERLLNEAAEYDANGNSVDAATTLAMAQMIEEMPATNTVSAPKAAGTSVRRTWKARVIDPAIVPAYANGIEIREIKLTALNSIAKMTSGTAAIPGVEFYEDVSIIAR